MKYLLSSTFKFTLMLLLITSCTENDMINSNNEYEDYNYSYVFEDVNLNSIITDKIELISSSKEAYIISSTFYSDTEIPKKLLEAKNTEEIKNFLLLNKHKLNVALLISIDGQPARIFKIGQNSDDNYKINQTERYDEYELKEECSYEGIRQCAKYTIYEEFNTIEKIACAFGEWECIGWVAFNCYAENCFKL